MVYQKHRKPHKDWHLSEMKKIHLKQDSLLNMFPQTPYFCGVDESGTGSILGPLSVGCVVLPRESELQVKDSKAYTTDTARSAAYERTVTSVSYGSVKLAQARTIDKYGQAPAKDYITFEMLEEVAASFSPTELVIVMDGAYIPKRLPDFLKLYTVLAVPKADATIKCVSAASVLAKVVKDKYLLELVRDNPELTKYGISENRGYCTPAHIAALKEHGPHNLHRFSCSPVKTAIASRA